MKVKLIMLLVISFFTNAFTQNNIGIGTITPNAKSILDLTSNDKGFLVPRLTSLERNAISPAGNADAALLVYDTDDNLFYYWNSTQWVPFPLAAGSNNISLNYNTATGTLSLTDNGGTLTANFPLDNDSDPTNELQNLSLSNNQLAISLTNSTVDLSPYLDNTDNQTLSLTGNTLAISNGNNVDLSSFAGDWKLLGNAGTNPTTNFLGTTDNQSLIFRTNNAEGM